MSIHNTPIRLVLLLLGLIGLAEALPFIAVPALATFGPVAVFSGTAVLIVLLKVVVAFAALMVGVMAMVWFERKLVADMQNRIGPNRAGPFGILQTLADGIKLWALGTDTAKDYVFNRLRMVSGPGAMHWHMPLMHWLPAPHALPHAPQLLLSNDVTTHVPLQLVWKG